MTGVVEGISAAAGVLKIYSGLKNEFWVPALKIVATSKDMDEIHKTLDAAVKTLGALKVHLHKEIEQRGKEPSEVYADWRRRVIKTEDETKINLLDKYEEKRKLRKKIQASARAEFSEKMKQMCEKIRNLIIEGHGLNPGMLVDPSPKAVIPMGDAPDIRDYTTQQTRLQKTLDLLKKDEVKVISIVGMMGTGKTAIIKNLNNHKEVAKDFQIVMWLKVSTEESEVNSDVTDLQKAVASRLELDMEGTYDFDSIAQRIHNVLKDKRYLLLLDDVKEDLDIHKMGIPHCENGSKIVLTTRLKHVCPLVDRLVEATYLTYDESWNMFKFFVNRPDLETDHKAKADTKKILKECGGHPLLIKIVASVFKSKTDLKLWGEGFNSMKRFSEKGNCGWKEMCNVIRFCFDDLEDTQKKCFLYGALYPEDSNIEVDYLLECWQAEDFLGAGDDAIEANISGRDILNHLNNRLLLEEDKSQKYVKMHKCIRQVALYISSDDPRYKLLVKTNEELLRPPEAKCWREKNWISLADNKFETLPKFPDCGSLSTLFLQKNSALKSIPPEFFDKVTCLKVLDLCHTGIESLPLPQVNSLKVLYVSYCKDLKKLPRNLDKLEVLDIRGCVFRNRPNDIGSFTRLRRFRASLTKCGNENGDIEEVDFDYAVISTLSKLEQLVIDLKSPRRRSNKVVGMIIKKVATLEKLTSLRIYFSDEVVDVIEVNTRTNNLLVHVPNADILRTFIEETRSWRDICHVRSFQFFSGCHTSDHPPFPGDHECKRYFKYCNGKGRNCPIFEVLKNVDAFEVVNHKDIKQLSDLGAPSMNKVRDCHIESCRALETAVDSTVLPDLEHLYMKDLPKLLSIWNDRVVVPESPIKLKTLVVSSCPMLRSIFPPAVVQHLHEIECLEIDDCVEIEEVVGIRNVDLLPKVRKLVLRNMPKLLSIWNDRVVPTSLIKLKTLVVSSCPMLKNIFPPAVIQHLREIECLGIEDCVEIMEVVEIGYLDLLPKLRKLALRNMPKLERICADDSSKWPTLEKLKIHNCPSLHKLPFKKDNAERLKLIQVEQQWWEELEWSNQSDREHFQQCCSFSS